MRREDDSPEAVAVENGIIIYTGDLIGAEELCIENTEKINLEGKVLMPSFIDAHSHFLQTAQNILMCDLSEANNFEDIYNTLKEYMEENEIGEDDVVLASGYDYSGCKSDESG